jgi:hypothetical protein
MALFCMIPDTNIAADIINDIVSIFDFIIASSLLAGVNY